MNMEPVNVSVSLTVATVVVCAAPSLLHAIVLNPAAAASTITIYDNATAASGTILAKLQAVANGESVVMAFNAPVVANNGITCVVAGTAATAQAYFQRIS